jgi:hypothetical protein
MTERVHPNGSGQRTARRQTPHSRSSRVWGGRTIPGLRRVAVAPETDPTILGFPAEYADEDDGADRIVDEPGPAISTTIEVLVLRRADRVGGGALVLAGVAANVSLMLSWSSGDGPTGLSLVQRGHRLLGVLALLVALAAAAAVVSLLADAGWVVDAFGPGMWCAVAVPVLGVLGALKAMLTPPLVSLEPR